MTRRATLFVYLAATLAAAVPQRALAQTAEAPAAPQIVPPRIVRDEGAAYPRQALDAKRSDRVTVVLVLDIDATGKVTKAVPQTPQGDGFDEAAVEAALRLQVEPATRNGNPVAARIKHQYEFAPPAGRLVGRLASQAADRSLAGARITITDASGAAAPLQATSDAQGNFVVENVPAGTYTVRIEAEGFQTVESREEVDAGSETAAQYRLERDASRALPEAPPPEGSKPAEVVEEVTVRGTRPPREITKRTLEQRELTRIPGTNGDALRAIQNLPGVARPPGLAGLLIVRGAAPNETNIFVDGTLVPIVYHFGGLSSVIPTEMLEKIDFYPGNFSTQYGRVTGAVVDVAVKDPRTDKLRGMAQVDFIDARVMAEGSLGKGWSFAVAGRRSYVDTWLGPVLNAAGAGVTTAPVYYDGQLMVKKQIDAKQSVRFFLFGSDDALSLVVKSGFGSAPAASGSVNLGTGFVRLQARYDNRISDDTQFRAMAAVGKDALDFSIGDNYFRLASYPVTTRAEVAHKLATGVKTNVGLDFLYAPYDVAVRFPPFPREGEPPAGPFGSQQSLTVEEKGTQFRPGIYQDFELTPWRGARIVPGARLDYTSDTKKWDFSPRVGVRQDVTQSPRTTLVGAVGVFRQPPQPQETNAVFGQTGLASNRATHYGLGIERELTRHVEVSVNGFYRDLDHLVVTNLGNSGSGRAFGAETLLRYKPDDKFFGFIAYTLSRSTRRDSPDAPERLFAFDQTHILTALGSYRLGGGWELGARFRLVSGSMSTPQQYGFFDQNAGAYLPFSYPLNGRRLPLFHQLDIRVDKTWTFKTWKLSAYMDLWNSYNAGNVEGVSYNYNSSLSTYGSSLPIIPSLGIRGEL